MLFPICGALLLSVLIQFALCFLYAYTFLLCGGPFTQQIFDNALQGMKKPITAFLNVQCLSIFCFLLYYFGILPKDRLICGFISGFVVFYMTILWIYVTVEFSKDRRRRLEEARMRFRWRQMILREAAPAA